MRTRLALTAIAALHAFGPADRGYAQQRQAQKPAEVEVLHVRGPIYLIAGAGANVTASIGPDGVLVADTGTDAMAHKVIAAIERLQRDLSAHAEPPLRWGALTRSTLERERATPGPPKPIRFVIITSADDDHAGGNSKVMGAGKTITGGNVAGDLGDAQDSAALYAHENVLLRLSKAAKPMKDGEAAIPLPTDTFFTPYYKLSHFFNGEGVQIIHLPKAHTDGDAMVWFRGSDVIAAGDVFSTGLERSRITRPPAPRLSIQPRSGAIA
jgi:glyoxylase-like metal-dependent hydrolase (beta-lactamase superfamily II)